MISEIQTIEQIAVANCATALKQSGVYALFEQSALALEQDKGAQEALRSLQNKRDSLRALIVLNAVSDTDRAELERLETSVFAHPTIDAYLHAEVQAAALCREVNDRISEAIGMRFALKLSSCCG